jgi:endonuclease/exonuclease/phosphatase (EEP) superfamily protein YafD
MKLIAWNLNHRAARRRIPSWIATAINEQAADAVVLTEYVEGRDHESFVGSLKASGFCKFSCSEQPGRQNQLLIASRYAHRRYDLVMPNIHPSVPSNVLEVSLAGPDVTVLGFRMPAFEGKDRALKRPTWNWLLGEAERLRASSALIVGDFNTAPGDSKTKCGDCLEKLVQCGWQHARPASGYSWRHPRFKTKREIDHIFLSPSLVPTQVEYSWEFERLVPEGTSRKAGYPDHAMLICEFNLASASLTDSQRRKPANLSLDQVRPPIPS